MQSGYRVLRMKIQDRLISSLEKAFRFIEASCNPSGLWSDFLTLAGESVFWVSGYAGYAMFQGEDGLEKDWLKEVAYRILEHQGGDGGWGYGPGVPPDADSTSWCILFLSKLGLQRSESLKKAVHFLLEHQNLDGGFRTYAFPISVGRYMGLDSDVSFEGWQASQLCVTGVATRVLIGAGSMEKVEDALNYIKKTQMEDGFWYPYWWNDVLYSTFNCMWALKAGSADSEIFEKACNWIAEIQLADGSWNDSTTEEGVAFSTALALKSLMLESRCSDSDIILKGVEWLLTHQMDDGSWPSYYLLRIPHPAMKEPWRYHAWKRDGRAIGSVIKDHRRLFTTATAFSALSMFDNLCRGELS
jgi:squalene cyclase